MTSTSIPRRFGAILAGIVVVLSTLSVAQADGSHHPVRSAHWDGYTYEHFDVLLAWTAGGHYWGQTSTWAEANMSLLGAKNKGDETCNWFGDTDWDTGWSYTYDTTQSWIEGSGGFATDLWDCTQFHSIEARGEGAWWNMSPSVSLRQDVLIPYEEDPN